MNQYFMKIQYTAQMSFFSPFFLTFAEACEMGHRSISPYFLSCWRSQPSQCWGHHLMKQEFSFVFQTRYIENQAHMCSVAKLYPTLCNPMDCSLPGSSVHGISRQEYRSRLPFPSPGIFPIQGLNPHLLCFLYWQADSLPLSHLRRLMVSTIILSAC